MVVTSKIVLVGKCMRACVCYIDRLVVRAEFKTIRCDEVISDSLNDASVGLETVDLWSNYWRWSEVSGRK